MPAPERIPPERLTPVEPSSPLAPGSGDGGATTGTVDPLALLTTGELTVRGQVREASNAVLLCSVTPAGGPGGDPGAGGGSAGAQVAADCVYKPVAGERPLWDFPDGTLAAREVAAYEISAATGWDLVPPTVLRDGPYGEGMVQLWIGGDPAASLLALVDGEEPGEGWKAVGLAQVDEDRTALLVHADDPRLRRLAVLDAVINNGDRKGGHLLPAPDGRLYAIDHGVTFHTDDKLRTLLWGWAGEPLTEEALEVLARLDAALAPGEPLAGRLAPLLTPAEITALRDRVAGLLKSARHPEPSGEWPAIPWPPV
ncbi:SCO1664 family protein [Streptomyces sp. LP05-1]|uniref:SCO1664 family protein n=1 Tax=Streptomyces pyxinae TaxID=2970734 RepID=A0ABT2CFC3_9ACTN|nr:SCO1664 family protein [Streptomyces sp. LP05-1]MCS0636114.1 SCO1664 family protein [Streptomyces sp. LP05-1]